MTERPTAATNAWPLATMRMVAVTAICENRCEVGDVTMTISFCRPVLRNPRVCCPWCGKPLRLLRVTVLQDGLGQPVGTLEEHAGVS